MDGICNDFDGIFCAWFPIGSPRSFDMQPQIKGRDRLAVLGRLDLYKRRKLRGERDLAWAWEGRPDVVGKNLFENYYLIDIVFSTPPRMLLEGYNQVIL